MLTPIDSKYNPYISTLQENNNVTSLVLPNETDMCHGAALFNHSKEINIVND